MIVVEVEKDLAFSQQLFKEYYLFEKKKELKKIPSLWIFMIGAALAALGLILENLLFFWTATCVLIVLVGFLVNYEFRVQNAIRKTNADLESGMKGMDKHFQFVFDEKELGYRSEQVNTMMKWSVIKRYEINGGSIYLYDTAETPFDIMSQQIMGEEKFQKFRSILVEKVALN